MQTSVLLEPLTSPQCLIIYRFCSIKQLCIWFFPYFNRDVKSRSSRQWAGYTLPTDQTIHNGNLSKVCCDVFTCEIRNTCNNQPDDNSTFINPGKKSYKFQKRDSAFTITGHSSPHQWECNKKKTLKYCPVLVQIFNVSVTTLSQRIERVELCFIHLNLADHLTIRTGPVIHPWCTTGNSEMGKIMEIKQHFVRK